MKVEDYGKWESMGFFRTFSDDGKWFIYDIRRNNDKNELRLLNLSTDDTKILSEGSGAAFSKNSQWLGYFINPTAAARKKSKTPLKRKFSLLNLNSNDSLIVENVSSFRFSDNSRFVAMKKNAAKGKKSKGTDLIVQELSTQKEYNFGNVSEYSWQDEGALLAMVIDAAGQTGNGIQIFDSETGVLSVLDNKEASYTGLKWREKSDDLVIMRSGKDENYEDSTHHILAWRGLQSTNVVSSVLDQSAAADHRIVNNRPLVWSKNGESVFFYITHWEKKPVKSDSTSKEEKNDVQDLTEEAPALQIWHSKDVQVIPEQKQRAQRKREDQYLSVWHIQENKMIRLADDLVERVNLQTDVKTLIGFDATPYDEDAMFGRGSSDIYTVNLASGAKKKILTNVNYAYDISPDAEWVPYVEGEDFYLFNTQTGRKTNLTQSLGATFVNKDDDHPTPSKRPYGFVAWEKSGNSFFAHSKFDVWQLSVDASKSRKLTDGESDQIRHRYSFLDFEDYIDEKASMYLTTFGNWTKKSGYARVTPGKSVKNLVWEDASVGRLRKAEDANVFAFSKETFSDSPDYFVTNEKFRKPKQISKTNPFQPEFAWGKSELIEYTNANGKKLQGALFYPANYEPGKKYPMITYIYELLSNGIHGYGVPSQRNYYSHSVFTHEGYFVLRPDIVFDAGDPGISSVRTMEAAVKKVVDMGLVDEKRVGLVGHSWGGYQAGYAVTQTDIFAASVAGAGLTNLTSMYGMIAWAFGGAPESAHFEVSQERMKVPPYQDVEGYIRNSSVFNVEKLNTPLLFEVGDADQNVDWRQGIEYYNAARRARKQFVLLVYANEGHGLRQDKNRADYQMRILKWFGHYLKGEPIEPWIANGISYEDQQKMLKNWKK